MSKKHSKKKRGRPALNRKRLHISVAEETFKPLQMLAKPFAGHIGVAVDQLVKAHEEAKQP